MGRSEICCIKKDSTSLYGTISDPEFAGFCIPGFEDPGIDPVHHEYISSIIHASGYTVAFACIQGAQIEVTLRFVGAARSVAGGNKSN